jgi:hypothetical protein
MLAKVRRSECGVSPFGSVSIFCFASRSLALSTARASTRRLTLVAPSCRPVDVPNTGASCKGFRLAGYSVSSSRRMGSMYTVRCPASVLDSRTVIVPRARSRSCQQGEHLANSQTGKYQRRQERSSLSVPNERRLIELGRTDQQRRYVVSPVEPGPPRRCRREPTPFALGGVAVNQFVLELASEGRAPSRARHSATNTSQMRSEGLPMAPSRLGTRRSGGLTAGAPPREAPSSGPDQR